MNLSRWTTRSSCGALITPNWKCSFFSGSELVSHNDFRGGPSLSNLCGDAGDGHNMHSDVHVQTLVAHVGPTTQNLCSVHMAPLCCPMIVFSCWGHRTSGMSSSTSQEKCWASWDVGVEQLDSWPWWHLQLYITSGSWRKVGVLWGMRWWMVEEGVGKKCRHVSNLEGK